MKSFTPFNDTDLNIIRTWRRANQARKDKAAKDAYYRQKHSEILQVILDTLPKGTNHKKHMDTCQALTDALMPLFLEEKQP